MNLPAPRRLFPSEPVGPIECLEPRIAPASLTFTEADGDTVTITTSKGTLSSGAGGNVMIVDGTLRELDLTDAAFQGSDVIITTKDGAAGMRDGLVKVGRIKADGRDLGEVKIKGDLGQIDAGDADPKTDGVKSLEVESLGKSGTDTQAAGGDLKSEIRGRLGKLKVKTDVKEATLDVIGEANGRIGKIEIGGNLTGGVAAGSGALRATGSIDSVSIGGNLEGSGGANSGQIQTSGRFKKIVIKGNISGGIGAGSGSIDVTNAGGKIDSITVGGNVTGGIGDGSGFIDGGSSLGTAEIGGSITGGSGANSGQISTSSVEKSVTVKGDLVGGNGGGSGAIKSGGKIDNVKVEGSVKGGDGVGSGRISSAGPMSRVRIDGELAGGVGLESGTIFSESGIGVSSIGKGIRGGDGTLSGILSSMGDIGKASIRGSIVGGQGDLSGGLGSAATLRGCVIVGDIRGADVEGNDSIQLSGFVSAKSISRLTVDGSIIAGQNTGTGTILRSGSVFADDDIAVLRITGDSVGNASNPVVISGGFGPVQDFVFKSIRIGGSVTETDILAGYNGNGTPVNADTQIGPIFVGGAFTSSNIVSGVGTGGDGDFGTEDDAALSGAGIANNPALFSTIARITIRGEARGNAGAAATGNFGIVAASFAAINVDGRALEISSGPGNDVIRIGASGDPLGDFFAREDVGT